MTLKARTSNVQHVYHHSEESKPKINVNVERNSRGVNYTATVTGARSVQEAIALANQTMEELRKTFETPQETK